MALPIDVAGAMALAPADVGADRGRVHEAGDGAAEVAEQFEGMLVQQLWQIMRRTVKSGGMLGGEGAGNDLYMSMVDDAMGRQLSEGGGIGIRSVLMQALGAESEAAPREVDSAAVRAFEFAPVHRPPPGPRTGAVLEGATGRLQEVAREMLTDESAPRWGRDGRLTETELSSQFSAEVPGGVARFNVRDSAGYQGYYKCNLFALEMARRAGFQVPLMARTRGYSYPHPDRVATDAADGGLRAGWGRVATGETAERLNAAIDSGDRAFMLTGSGHGDRAGHMGVVEQVHEVHYDEQGEIERVVFDGWEARSHGAEHLSRRTWNRYGNASGGPARNGLDRIELIELLPPESAESQEIPLSRRAGPSIRDAGR